MNQHQLWQRIHTCLDAGVDPIDDSQVQEALFAQPELLEELAELRSRLRQVAGPVPGKRRRLALAAAAAVLLLGGIGWAGLSWAGLSWASRHGDDGSPPLPELRQDLRVLHLRIATEIGIGDASQAIEVEQGTLQVTETTTRRGQASGRPLMFEIQHRHSRVRAEHLQQKP